MPKTVRSLARRQTRARALHRRAARPGAVERDLSARASSFGDEGLFVCKTPARAYDIDENRVLVAALAMIRDAALVAEHNRPRAGVDEVIRGPAQRQRGQPRIEHRRSPRVTRDRPTARAIKAHPGRARDYQPAVSVDRGERRSRRRRPRWSPVRRARAASSGVLLALADRLRAHRRVHGATLRAGALRYVPSPRRTRYAVRHPARQSRARRARSGQRTTTPCTSERRLFERSVRTTRAARQSGTRRRTSRCRLAPARGLLVDHRAKRLDEHCERGPSLAAAPMNPRPSLVARAAVE